MGQSPMPNVLTSFVCGQVFIAASHKMLLTSQALRHGSNVKMTPQRSRNVLWKHGLYFENHLWKDLLRPSSEDMAIIWRGGINGSPESRTDPAIFKMAFGAPKMSVTYGVGQR